MGVVLLKIAGQAKPAGEIALFLASAQLHVTSPARRSPPVSRPPRVAILRGRDEAYAIETRQRQRI